MGVAYRYFDLRMNVAPLFPERKLAVDLWIETIRWWIDPTIRLRFVESQDGVWFIAAAESSMPETNLALFKLLPRSANYERFKKGHGGEAYIRFGIYQERYAKDAKDDAQCDCGHIREDHDDTGTCLYEECDCTRFKSFQITFLRKKKAVTDIRFLDEEEVRDDSLAWNCLYVNRYADQEQRQ